MFAAILLSCSLCLEVGGIGCFDDNGGNGGGLTENKTKEVRAHSEPGLSYLQTCHIEIVRNFGFILK